MLCSAVEFKHLPMAGGLFDQNPDMLDRFMYIWSEQQKEERQKEARERRAKGGPTPRNGGVPPGA